MRLELARHPKHPRAKNPLVIEEMLALADDGKQRGVATMIKMLKELFEQGRSSQYLVKMKSSPMWELKPASRGGEAGGARVYLFLLDDDAAGIVNCEIKESAAPDIEKLQTVL